MSPKSSAARLRFPLVFFLAVLSISFLVPLVARSAPPQPVLIGIDHMPLAVKNLDAATDRYRQLGFAIKPGRFHENGIRNNHVKFPDGAGIELITASEPKDAITTSYRELLAQGDGPAYFAFHARNTERLVAALVAARIDYSQAGGLIELRDPRFSFIFFVRDNRSSTDRPEHFAHANSAIAMTAVWIASRDTESLAGLLTALGGVPSKETVFVPDPVAATVFTVENGKVVLLPESHQVIKGRPIVGAEFRVRDLEPVTKALASLHIQPVLPAGKTARHKVFVPPGATHGIWLAFAQ